MALAVAPGFTGSRAAQPDDEGYVERDGVRILWERYGDGRPTILFLPTWSVCDSRVWRNQIAYFARHCRVVVFDGRGNGKSDRPLEPSAYLPHEFVADALAVMEASSTASAIVVSLSMLTTWSLLLSATAPDRVQASVFVGPTTYAVREPFPEWSRQPFNERLESYEGFQGQNRWFILEHYAQFLESWARLGTPEPHSTRAIEYAVGMGLQTTSDVILATLDAYAMDGYQCTAERLREAGALLQPLAREIRCPVLVLEGALDAICPPHWAHALAEDTRGQFMLIEDGGHCPGGRKPVRFNLELHRFVARIAARAATRR